MTTPFNPTPSKQPVMSNRLYDALKFTAQIVLPALGTLYFGLAMIWNLPKAEEVVGTVTVVDTFLGVLLGLTTKQYNNSDAKYDGHIEVESTSPDGPKVFSLNLHSDPETLDQKKEVVFKVSPQ